MTGTLASWHLGCSKLTPLNRPKELGTWKRNSTNLFIHNTDPHVRLSPSLTMEHMNCRCTHCLPGECIKTTFPIVRTNETVNKPIAFNGMLESWHNIVWKAPYRNRCHWRSFWKIGGNCQKRKLQSNSSNFFLMTHPMESHRAHDGPSR